MWLTSVVIKGYVPNVSTVSSSFSLTECSKTLLKYTVADLLCSLVLLWKCVKVTVFHVQ